MACGKLAGNNSAKLFSACSLLDSGAVQVHGPRAACTSARSQAAGVFEACAAEVELHVDPSICNRADRFLPWPLQDTNTDTVKHLLHDLSANWDTLWVVPCYFEISYSSLLQKRLFLLSTRKCHLLQRSLSIVLLTAGQCSIFISLVKKDQELKECSPVSSGWRDTVVCVLICIVLQHTGCCFCTFQNRSTFKMLEIPSNAAFYQWI